MLSRRPSRASLLRAGILLLLGLFGTLPIPAQTLSEEQVKAAYVFSFAKFIEWPAGTFPTPNSSLRFCVLNDRAFQAELDRIVKNKSIAGHSIDVLQVEDGDQSRSCQLLFIDSGQDRQTRHVLEVLRGASVLTIGETEGFLNENGIINFVLEDDHVHFEINHKAASEAGLYISSRLLGVAKRVIE